MNHTLKVSPMYHFVKYILGTPLIVHRNTNLPEYSLIFVWDQCTHITLHKHSTFTSVWKHHVLTGNIVFIPVFHCQRKKAFHNMWSVYIKLLFYLVRGFSDNLELQFRILST